jgi:hypothetical protein
VICGSVDWIEQQPVSGYIGQGCGVFPLQEVAVELEIANLISVGHIRGFPYSNFSIAASMTLYYDGAYYATSSK